MTRLPARSPGPGPSGGLIRVLLADDHSVVREGISAVLKKRAPDILVVGEAANGTAALELARRTQADVYVLDISMPSLNGLDVMARLLHKDLKAKVVILSMHDDRPTIEKALRAGARGYVIKESAAEDIVSALRAVHRGGRYLSPSASSVELSDIVDASSGEMQLPAAGLTQREREIIQLIAEGLGQKQVARRLGITENTVHVHRHNIALKLNIHKQTDLVRYAVQERIVAL